MVPLSDAESSLLSDIVERRLRYMGGSANEVRKFTLRECVVCGLMAIARSEGML